MSSSSEAQHSLTPLRHAAGVLFVTPDGKFLTTKRAPCASHAGTWDLPGGSAEPGESLEATARREFEEETGQPLTAPLTLLTSRTKDGCHFVTFTAAGDEFTPALSPEHTAAAWVPVKDPVVTNFHPGLQVLIEFLASDELGVARLMRAGELDSPQRYENIWFYALRISGTGYAYRTGHEEFVWRDPSVYLTADFLERCQGLPVILQHPDGLMMSTDDYKERVIGSIMLPFIQGSEVWGIARINDQVAGQLMVEYQLSTSPGVTFTNPKEVNTKLTLTTGESLLFEGKPDLLDHLAVCPQGVWDKGGAPTGVDLSTIQGDLSMSDDEKARQDAERLAKLDAVPQMLDKVLACMDAMTKRMDGYDERMDAMKVRWDADDKAKLDATAAEKAMMDAAEKAKMDAEKAKLDAAAAHSTELAARLAALEASQPKPRSDEDHAAFAAAQAKGDQVYAMFGDSASRPMQGEDLLAYRQRLASGLKGHSETYKGVDLAGIKDATLFGVVEKAIYADAAAAAMRPSEGGEVLREVKTADRSGRMVSTFFGHPGAWMGSFRTVGRRVTKISKDVAA